MKTSLKPRQERGIGLSIAVLVVSFAVAPAKATASESWVGSNVLKVTGPLIAMPKHLPEVQEFTEDETWKHRVCWILFSTVIGVIILCVGHDWYRMAKAYLFRILNFLTGGKRVCSLAGQWVDADLGLSVLIMRRTASPWPLTVKEQGYMLVVKKYDERIGKGEGDIKCTRGRHIVGTWTMEPATDYPNRFKLILTFTDGKSICAVIRRAE